MTLRPDARLGPYEILASRPAVVTPHGSAHGYSFARRLSDLYLVEGLK